MALHLLEGNGLMTVRYVLGRLRNTEEGYKLWTIHILNVGSPFFLLLKTGQCSKTRPGSRGTKRLTLGSNQRPCG